MHYTHSHEPTAIGIITPWGLGGALANALAASAAGCFGWGGTVERDLSLIALNPIQLSPDGYLRQSLPAKDLWI